MSSKLYVANLAAVTTEDALRGAFEEFGTISDVFIATDRVTGRPRGFAFITFSSAAEGQAAIEKRNGFELDGRTLTVTAARPKEGEAAPEGTRARNFGPDRKAGAFQSRYRNRR